MKGVRAGVVALLSLGIAQSVFAADMPVKAARTVVQAPSFSWAGYYIGLNAGYAWGRSDVSSINSCPAGAGCAYTLPANLSAFNAAGTGKLSPSGFTGGFQAGYNWQTGALVSGVEADFDAFNLSRTRSAGGLVPIGAGQSFLVTTATKTDWLFTARGRLGWAFAPSALVYATGGLAVTKLKVSNSFADTFVPIQSGASTHGVTKAGWVVGAGAEWAVGGNWSVKAEYLYVNFGSVSTSAFPNFAGNANPNLLVTSANLHANIARVGVNYRFARVGE